MAFLIFRGHSLVIAVHSLSFKNLSLFDMSTIDNLKDIKENGMDSFLQKQEEKYKCPKCGGVICVHNGKCYSCYTVFEEKLR